METATQSSWEPLRSTARTLFWLAFVLMRLQQLCGSSRTAATRADLLGTPPVAGR